MTIGVGLAGRLGAVPPSVAACGDPAVNVYIMAETLMEQGRVEDAVAQYTIAYQSCPNPAILARLRAAVASQKGVGFGTAVIVGGSLLVLGFVLGKVM